MPIVGRCIPVRGGTTLAPGMWGRFMITEHYVELEKLYGAHDYEPLDIVLERGEGVWVWA